MNRLELLTLLLALFVASIILIRSKWFDRQVEKLLRGTNSETASELKADIKQSEEKKKQIQKNLDNEAKRLESERNVINKL